MHSVGKDEACETTEGSKAMRELANSFVQLTAIILFMITLAVSTAAFAQWAGGEMAQGGASGDSAPSTLLVAGAAR